MLKIVLMVKIVFLEIETRIPLLELELKISTELVAFISSVLCSFIVILFSLSVSSKLRN